MEEVQPLNQNQNLDNPDRPVHVRQGVYDLSDEQSQNFSNQLFGIANNQAPI